MMLLTNKSFFASKLLQFSKKRSRNNLLFKKKYSTMADKIIELSDIESYFEIYCSRKVNVFALQHDWSFDKRIRVLNKVQFRDFSENIYSLLMSFSPQDLNIMLTTLSLMNKTKLKYGNMIFMNQSFQNELDVYVKSIIDSACFTKSAAS